MFGYAGGCVAHAAQRGAMRRPAARSCTTGKLELSREILYKADKLTDANSPDAEAVSRGARVLDRGRSSVVIRSSWSTTTVRRDRLQLDERRGDSARARIISVADVYDSLTSVARTGRRCDQEARDVLRRERSPKSIEVVTAFLTGSRGETRWVGAAGAA